MKFSYKKIIPFFYIFDICTYISILFNDPNYFSCKIYVDRLKFFLLFYFPDSFGYVELQFQDHYIATALASPFYFLMKKNNDDVKD